MTDAAPATPPAPPRSPLSAPLHAPATNNAGQPTPDLAAHQQQPDAVHVPGALEWVRMSPEARSAYTREVADRRDFSGPGFIQKRDADGNPYMIDRATGKVVKGTGPAVALQAAEVHADPADPAPTEADPTVTVGEKFKFGDLELSADEIQALASEKAERDLAARNRPATPTDYRAELPEGTKLPGGVTYKFDTADPAIAAAQNLAHEKGWSQQDFSDALAVYAGHVTQQQAMVDTARTAEVTKLGTNAPQRVDTVTKWLDANGLGALKVSMVSARQVEAIENFITKQANQGVGSFSQSHRDHQPQGRVSDDEWSQMSAADRLNYSRGFDQSQFTGSTRR